MLLWMKPLQMSGDEEIGRPYSNQNKPQACYTTKEYLVPEIIQKTGCFGSIKMYEEAEWTDQRFQSHCLTPTTPKDILLLSEFFSSLFPPVWKCWRKNQLKYNLVLPHIPVMSEKRLSGSVESVNGYWSLHFQRCRPRGLEEPKRMFLCWKDGEEISECL